jgi:hypothetical protein
MPVHRRNFGISPRHRIAGVPRLSKLVVALLAATLAVLGAVGAILASAAVPTFPDNILIFPNRDFVSVQGYQDHIGQTATVTVTRGAQVIGSTEAVVREGDVAFEVNHPGGVCWGAGTGLKVTPDIQAGDRVQISFPGTSNAGDATVQDAFVTADAVLSGSTVTVTGHIAPGVIKTQTEQRIVEAALVDTAVARRDVRAVPGPLVRAAKGGYSSGMAFGPGDTFTATYEFDDPAVAKIAANAALGERMMAWQEEDAAANRQGLTIGEFGEPGGPGVGGCPAGPANASPPAGNFSAVRSADKSSIQVNWTPVDPVPTADPVSGFSIEALAPAGTNGEQSTIGSRTGATATRTTLKVDPAIADYTIEVRSMAASKMGVPFDAVSTPRPPSGDMTPPVVKSTPGANSDPNIAVQAPNGVTLSSEAGADIYYTVDGSSAISGDLPSDSAWLYKPGTVVPVDKTIEIHWVGFDKVGNSDAGFGTFSPPAAAPATPPKMTTPTATAGQEQVALKWAASTDSTATAYQVTVYDALGATPIGPQPAETVDLTQTVTGLTGGTTYQFTVKAKNKGGFGPESDKISAIAKVKTDVVTITRAQYRTGDFRVDGTSTAGSGTVDVYEAVKDATGATVPKATPITGMTAVALTPAVPPATGTTFTVRLRTNLPAKPAQIFVRSSNGGIAGPFAVTT